MKPYYEAGDIAIYHGDALELLHSGIVSSLDAVVGDPPYASGARSEVAKPNMTGMLRGVRWAGKPIDNDQMTTTGFVWLMRELARAAFPLLTDGGAFFAFIDWRQWPNLVGAIESANYRVNGMIVWDKVSFGTGYYLRKQHELILAASKGKPRVESHAIPDVIRHKRDLNNRHPSPKPVGLMEKLLTVATEPGQLVLDPFMGSGSTLVAAKLLRRRAIGCELRESYCEDAAKWLERTMAG